MIILGGTKVGCCMSHLTNNQAFLIGFYSLSMMNINFSFQGRCMIYSFDLMEIVTSSLCSSVLDWSILFEVVALLLIVSSELFKNMEFYKSHIFRNIS
jgi:hypothetical protein